MLSTASVLCVTCLVDQIGYFLYFPALYVFAAAASALFYDQILMTTIAKQLWHSDWTRIN